MSDNKNSEKQEVKKEITKTLNYKNKSERAKFTKRHGAQKSNY